MVTSIYELVCLLLVVQCQLTSLTPLLVTTFFENSTSPLFSAAQDSVEMINGRGDILPSNYTLSLVRGDSGSIESTLLSYMKNIVYSDEDSGCIVGIIGPDNNQNSVKIISSLANRYRVGIPHIHFSTLPSLQNRDMYTDSFGILGSQLYLVDALVSMVHHQNWKDISVLYEEDNELFQQSIEYFTAQLSIKVTKEPIKMSYIHLDKKYISRVVVIMAGAPLVCEVLEKAVNKGLEYPVFQIIILGLKYEYLYSECQFDNLHFVLDQLLLITITFNVVKRNTRETYCHGCFKPSHCYVNESLVVDSIWALALAINKTLYTTNNSCSNEHFNSFVSSNLVNTKLDGYFGHIIFDSATGYNVRTVDIFQVYNNTLKQIGLFYNGSFSLNTDNFLINISLGRQLVSVRVEVASILTVPTIIQFCVIVSLHILTVVYRNHKSIKASNSKLSHTVFLGCYLLITTLMLFLWPLKTVPVLENLADVCTTFNFWLLPVSLTLIFGPLIAHVWRLHKIFTNFNTSGFCLSNIALYGLIILMILVDLFIGTLNTALNETQVSYTFTGRVSQEGRVIESAMCHQPPQTWVLVFIYKYIQAAALLVLSCLTSNVKMSRDFSTGRFKIATYSIIVLSSILLPLYIMLWITNADIHADVIVICILANGFLLLCTLFILLPPVLGVLRTHRKINRYPNAVFL